MQRPQEVRNHYGTGADYRLKIESIEDAYYFLKFERIIKKKRAEFSDVRSNANTERLKNELYSVHNIMSQNIDLVLDREKNLNQMSDKASNLKMHSKQFRDKSKDLAWSMWLRKNMIYLVVLGLIVVFLYLKVF
eukprot:TRINITY_DN821_c0_g2_i2.p2 TRINITY_DN821_c0_g2~~TRINITY_DN821_c0_g2_i2.p2  ORF type:complete len:134 (-),score=26.09 TRINITY_DN821_c0_g2_i2:184-585(-)